MRGSRRALRTGQLVFIVARGEATERGISSPVVRVRQATTTKVVCTFSEQAQGGGNRVPGKCTAPRNRELGEQIWDGVFSNRRALLQLA